MPPRLCLIAAMARNRTIGIDNRLPWRLPEDLRHFKVLTLGKPVIMGRKTWESLPNPLPGRHNIVVSRNTGYQAEGATVVTSLTTALAAAGSAPEVFVIGGETLYREALPVAEIIHLTVLDDEFAGDAFFPELPAGDWKEATRTPLHAANGMTGAFLCLQRCPVAG